MATRHNYDAIVVGGGIIGTAVIYYLAKQGIQVCLLEKASLAEGTTGSGGGSISLQDKSPGLLLELGLQSVCLYQGLSAELERDIGFRACGGIVPAVSETELMYLEQYIQPLQEEGLPAQMIDRRASKYLEPSLGDSVLGASYCPLEAKVDPIRVTAAFGAAATRLGAQIHRDTEVVDLSAIDESRFRARTKRGEFEAPWLVNAAGIWSPRIAGMLGIRLPVVPRKGQIVVLEAQGSIVQTVMHGPDYFQVRFDDDSRAGEGISSDRGVAFALEQRGPYLRVGSSREFAGFDTTTDRRVSAQILVVASRFVPRVSSLGVLGEIGCLRPYTSDHRPIIGALPGLPNFLCATGHEGEGVGLAPITGKLIAELVTRGEASVEIEDLSPSRFDLKP